jgi:cytosine/adenosine deaminase-related metal-dependent hydrolase
VLETCARLAQEHPDLVAHTHTLEMPQANVAARAMGAADSIGLFEDLGLLNERLVLAHLVAATDRDIDRVANAGAHVIHYPSMFTYFGTGNKLWLPSPQLLKRGGNAALRLDDPGWIDSSDLFREAKLAASPANFLWGAPQLTTHQVLRVLTINGARALGLGEELGSLEVGKQADLLLLDFRQLKFRPLNNLPALLVNTTTRDDVDTVVVGGQLLMQGRRVLTMDETRVMEEAQRAMDEAAKVTGWHISLAESRPPRTSVGLRMPPNAKALGWTARLGWQVMEERIRPGQGDE